MIRKKSMWLAVLVFATTIFGCREEHRYDYKLVYLSLMKGGFVVNVIGHYGKNYSEKGKDKIDFGSPYNISFEYSVDLSEEIFSLGVKDIEIVGERTGTVITLAEVKGDKVRVYGDKKSIRIAAGPLMVKREDYQNYSLKMTVVVFRNSEEYEEKIVSVILETDYRKERRSDWFDEKTGV